MVAKPLNRDSFEQAIGIMPFYCQSSFQWPCVVDNPSTWHFQPSPGVSRGLRSKQPKPLQTRRRKSIQEEACGHMETVPVTTGEGNARATKTMAL
ncbi:hypothetical protein MRB53_006254 [Persea americana]|uniref:Uncharacterized protein n=1 Tax=Persea americana TaxID=3435 RepID=A0ACC2MFW5_PERAE|nr:hypothetical protein MRB53_006254 [Persea americana]